MKSNPFGRNKKTPPSSPTVGSILRQWDSSYAPPDTFTLSDWIHWVDSAHPTTPLETESLIKLKRLFLLWRQEQIIHIAKRKITPFRPYSKLSVRPNPDSTPLQQESLRLQGASEPLISPLGLADPSTPGRA